MALTYGFYNSLSGDRKYNAVQISEMFDGIINDGIYESIGDKFIVRASTGMKVTVGSGRAFFNHTWTKNDAQIVLTVPASNVVLNRIDTVVLEVNSDPGVRANSIKIVSGTPANDPQAPTMVHSEYINQYPLANIYVGADVTAITQSNITNRRGTSACPFVTGILQVTSIDDLIAQWVAEWDEWLSSTNSEYTAWKTATQTDFTAWSTSQKAAFVEWMNESKGDFDTWFDNLQYVLDGDVAGHLQNEIESNADAISANATLSKSSDTSLYQFRRCTHNAVYDKLVGISYAKNQLVPKTESTGTANGVTYTNNNDGSWTLTGTPTTNNAFKNLGVSVGQNAMKLFPNHVYYATAGSPANIKVGIQIRWNYQGSAEHCLYDSTGAASDATQNHVLKFTQSEAPYTSWARIQISTLINTDIGTQKVIPQMVDLTLMFGTAIADKIYAMEQAEAGSGLAWIRQYGFLNDTYIEYNAGVIESSAPTYRKVVGFNQWDEEWEVGAYTTNGEKDSSTANVRSKNFMKVLPSQQYYFYYGSGGANLARFVNYYDENKTFISRLGLTTVNTFITPANARYITFFTGTAYGKTYNNDICINISDPTKNGTYEPYKEVIYPLGGDTLRGVPQLVGDDLVADGDIKTSDGVMNRTYGENTDLSALTWEYVSSLGCFKAGIVDGKPSTTQQGTGKGVCSKYAVVQKAYADMNDGEMLVGSWIGGTSNLYLAVKDSQYGNNATAFKNSLSNVHLVYELKTPTSSVSTPFISPQVSLATEETDTICGHDSVVVDIPEWMQNEYFDDVRADASMAHGLQTELDKLDCGEDSLMNEGIRYPVINGIRNYVDANGVYHKNLGCVDLGTLNWFYDMEKVRFSTTSISSVVKPAITNETTTNIRCYKYATTSLTGLVNNGVAVAMSGNLFVRNTSYSDAAAFKSAMSGVLLFYELATPQTWNTKSIVDELQPKSDSSLQTTNKTVVGAINEVNTALGGKKIVVCPEAQRGSNPNTLYFCY